VKSLFFDHVENGQYKYLLLLPIFAIFLSINLVFLFFVYIDFDKRINSRSHDMKQFSDALFFDITDTLERLNSYEKGVCDKNLLLSMRKEMYKSKSIKDIGYFIGGKLICTTGIGMLNVPFKGDEPHLKANNGVDMWVNQPLILFNEKVTGHIIRFKRFNAVYSFDGFIRSTSSGIKSTVFLDNKLGNLRYITGSEGLLAGIKKFDTSHFSKTGLQNIMCSAQSNICVVSAISHKDILYSARVPLVVVILISFLVSIFMYFYFRNKLERLGSDEYRFLRALKIGKIVGYYQPIVDLTTHDIVGCEVLARWLDDEEVRTPYHFLDYVGKNNKTHELTKSIVNRTFKDLCGFLKKNDNFKLSFNIFPEDFNTRFVEGMFREHFNKHSNIEINLEITEDNLADVAVVADEMKKIKACGYRVSIDDFGTGYSSLSYLRDLPVDYLKIDRAFIKDFDKNPVKSKLVPYMVALANELDIRVIVEGVESTGQLNFVKELGIEFSQGYFFSKPLSKKDFIEFCNPTY